MAAGATAETPFVAPAFVLRANAALRPLSLQDSLPVSQTGEEATLGTSVVQSRGLKTRTAGVAAISGDSKSDTVQSSGPRCDTSSPGARSDTAVEVFSPHMPHCFTLEPALTCETFEASGTAAPPNPPQQILDSTGTAAAPSAPHLTPEVTVNLVLEFLGAA